jgi:hypothetical protein
MDGSHQDRFRSPHGKIDKDEWEKIFGKREDAMKKPDTVRGRVRRDKDDFMNRPTKWV